MSETKDTDGAQKGAASADKPKLVPCTVAPRRTVVKDDRRHGPGAIIHLPAAEVARLRELGFLTSPGAPELEVVTGDMPKVVHGA